jgi:hypothetical protein
MKWMVFAALICGLTTSSYAIDARSAAFYCTPDAAGGVSFNEQQGKWTGTIFRPGKAFVLKLNFVSSDRKKMFPQFSTDLSTVNSFDVAVTEAGSSVEAPCTNLNGSKLPVEVWDDGWLRCNWSLSDFRFKVETNRFLKAYLIGYIDGSDKNSDTPAVTVGVCTKIN